MKEKTYCCGLNAALDVVGGKWKVLILWALQGDERRFGDLRRMVVGISEKMLIQSLREMEADGIATRIDYKEVPPRVEYKLTSFGGTLLTALVPLCLWGESHRARIEAAKHDTGTHKPANAGAKDKSDRETADAPVGA